MRSFLALMFAVALGLTGCRPSEQGNVRIEKPADLKGCRCGAVIGTSIEEVVKSFEPDLEFHHFNDYPSMVDALLLGKIDVAPTDTILARQWVQKRPNDLRIAITKGQNPYGYFFAKGNPLRDRVNGVLREMIASGEVERLVTKWADAPDLDKVALEHDVVVGGTDRKGGTLKFSSSCEEEPGAFMRNGRPVGFDIDIVGKIAAVIGMNLEVVRLPMTSRIVAVQSGKTDMGGGCITITEERKVSVDFSDCYYDGGFSFIVCRDARAGIRTPAQLKGCRVAHMSSDFHRRELKALQPAIRFEPYSEYAFAVESLRGGKIDAISLGRTYAELWLSKFPGEFRIAFDYAKDTCAFLLPKGSPLKAKVDAEIRKMNESGETAKIVRKWFEASRENRTEKLPSFGPAPAGAREVRVACAAQEEPWCFVANGEPVGTDVEILMTVAHRLGLKLKTKIYSWGGMVDAVNGNKTDIAAGGIYTGGNTFPTVDASEKYADETMCLLVRDVEKSVRGAGVMRKNGATFLGSLKRSFIRTFVTEARWKMLAKGLGITLLITFLSSLLATALAFPVWLARTAPNRFVSTCASWYISVLQGTPVLVLLMVLFYLVFGSVDVDGIWVAVIGFGLNGSAYVGETLRSGIGSIPVGQTEAALALGYTPRQAFFRFVLPQAVKAIMPVYRGELISILKSTSIVGYIAINDLTKASDLVRSRTYESFFPILTTAFIYFVAAWLLAQALDRLGKRI